MVTLSGFCNIAISKTFYLSKTYNVFNIPVQIIYPNKSVEERNFNAVGLLNQVRLKDNNQSAWQEIIRKIEYNPKNQKITIKYGNNTSSFYKYDPDTYRLIASKTIRHIDSNTIMENQYFYDASGNMMLTRDNAIDAICNHNQLIEPESKYEYDALYRLIYAEGREQSAFMFHPDQCNEIPCKPASNINDCQDMRNFREYYSYDEVGNVLQSKHVSVNHTSIQKFKYRNENNQLIAYNLDDSGITENIQSDANGNIIHTPHLYKLEWNHLNRLLEVKKDSSNNSISKYYYDSGGIRTFKKSDRGIVHDQNFYIDNFDNFISESGGNKKEEKITIKILLDDSTLLALYETISKKNEQPKIITRFEHTNYSNTSTLETNEKGVIIVYEEFLPFGSTSHCTSTMVEVGLKNYRYRSKEKDDETGFYYFGARYYASCYMRWCSPDPAGSADGYNLFVYNLNNPIGRNDKFGFQSAEIKDKDNGQFTKSEKQGDGEAKSKDPQSGDKPKGEDSSKSEISPKDGPPNSAPEVKDKDETSTTDDGLKKGIPTNASNPNENVGSPSSQENQPTSDPQKSSDEIIQGYDPRTDPDSEHYDPNYDPDTDPWNDPNYDPFENDYDPDTGYRIDNDDHNEEDKVCEPETCVFVEDANKEIKGWDCSICYEKCSDGSRITTFDCGYY